VYQYLLAEFATGELGAADRDADKAFETALLVVSPPGTFGWKVRKVGREAFEDRFIISLRQRAASDIDILLRCRLATVGRRRRM